MSPHPRAPFPVDLQVHSTRSDGTDAPAALVEKAAALGVRVLALTDHDSVLGVDEALRAGVRRGVTIIPALEFSTRDEPDRDMRDVNILGYGIDHRDPGLQAALQRVIDSRVEQKIRQVKRLQSYDVDVPVDEVLAEAEGVPGRVHIARVALRRNPNRFSSIDDVFVQYLSTSAPNSTYAPRTFSLRVEDAIELTHRAGGVAVLAHPGVYQRIRDVDGMVRKLADAGLDGLEVNYTYAQNRGHKGASSEEVGALIAHFDALADECRLIKTGGSDYHGATKPGIAIGQTGLSWSQWETIRNLFSRHT
jgi:predicted metal-dependent phosphoesterase TrpH